MSVKKYVKRVGRYLLKGVPVNHITANIVTIAPSELLKGRRALITGGTSGIGYAIASAFLRSGANVVIAGRNEHRLQGSCNDLSRINPIYKDKVSYQVMDVRNVRNIASVFDKAPELDKIDLLVNNAGVLGGDISVATEEEYDNILDTNLKGAFFLTQTVARNMKFAKIRGNILNICSSSSLRPASSAYTLSKWGMRGFTLGMAKVLAPYGITVNGIAPGPTATPMLLKGKISEISLENSTVGRYAMPEEIANMAVVLVSEMGRMVIGDIVYMTGGAGVVTFDDTSYQF